MDKAGGELIKFKALPSRLKSRWVFPSETDETPLDPKNFMSWVFVPALARAGIENLHWHDLRHTFASRLVMKGVDLRTVQELMWHKTITMTLRYAHLSPAHQLEAVPHASDRQVRSQSVNSVRLGLRHVVPRHAAPATGVEPAPAENDA